MATSNKVSPLKVAKAEKIVLREEKEESNISRIISSQIIRHYLISKYPYKTIKQILYYYRNISIYINNIYYTSGEKLDRDFKTLIDNNLFFTVDKKELLIRQKRVKRQKTGDKFRDKLQLIFDLLLSENNPEKRERVYDYLDKFLADNLPGNGYYKLKLVFNDGVIEYKAINKYNYGDFLILLKHDYKENIDGTYINSADLANLNFTNLIEIEIVSDLLKYVVKENKRKRNSGAIFPYLNTVDEFLDLTSFQICSKNNANLISKDNCLINSLKPFLNQNNLFEISKQIKNDYYPKNKLNIVCRILNKNIILHELVQKNRGEYEIVITEFFKNRSKELVHKDLINVKDKIQIGLLYNHYIPFKMICFSKALIPHLNNNDYKDKIKSLITKNKFVKKVLSVNGKLKFYYSDKPLFIDSVRLIYLMMKNKLFEKMTVEDVDKIFETRADKLKYLKALEAGDDVILEEDLNHFETPLGKGVYFDSKEEKYQYFVKEPSFIVFADTETYTDNIVFNKKIINKNVSYSISYTSYTMEEIYNYFKTGQIVDKPIFSINSDERIDCISKFYENLNKINITRELNNNPLIYFHNLKFDLSVHGENPNIKHVNRVQKESIIYKETIQYFGKCYDVVDSYKTIPEPLKNFSKMFKLKENKELMPYNLYNKENVHKKILTIEELKNEFDSKPNKRINNISFKKFLQHVLDLEKSENFCRTHSEFVQKINGEVKLDSIFYLLRYSNYYCKRDVKILAKGLLSFGRSIYNEFSFKLIDQIPINIEELDEEYIKILYKKRRFNIFNYLTISSFSHDYMIKKGVYTNTTLLKNSVDNFIKKGINGGKVMCYNNKPQKYSIKEFNKKLPKQDKILLKDLKTKDFSNHIVDYDAVSCYPSAMYFMDGVPIGRPVLLDPKTDLNTLTGHFYFSMQIRSFKRNSSFPSIYVKNGKNDKQYLNKIPEELIYGDKYKFQELMLNHVLEDYEIKTLIYFPNGYDNKINKVIKDLFDKRLQLKSEKNQLEQVYKLILNSAYGKTIMKHSEQRYQFFNGSEKEMLEEWDKKGYEGVTVTKINTDQYLFSYHEYEDYYSLAHVGVNILSYSKLIMLKVLYLADELGIKIFYTDTDSVHLVYKDLLKIIEHDPNLTGKNLGQFHTDYKMDGNYDLVFGIAKIALNKKEYCVILEGINSETGEIKREEVFRYKGLKEEAIKKYANEWVEKNNIDTNYPVYELFNSNQKHLIEQVTENTIQVRVYNRGLVSECLKSAIKEADFTQYKNTYDRFNSI